MSYTHVLITRPLPEAAKLAAELSATLGDAFGTPIIQPAFEFESLDSEIDFDHAWTDSGRRLAIFCSPRAVQFAHARLSQQFFSDVTVAAIGPATASALEQAGCHEVITPEAPWTSESLLALPELNKDPGQVLIFTRPGGRKALFEGLVGRGWQVRWAHVYLANTVEPTRKTVDMLSRGGKVLSIWTSANAMQHFAQCLPQQQWDTVCQGDFLVTSQRLADIARTYCRGEVVLTKGPGNDAILAAISSTVAR